MGRAPCCDKANVKRGPWSPEEDSKLKDFIERYGTGGNWIALPQKAGLRRCGKSCRLRWLNYLRPNIKHGEFSEEEDRIILNLFISIGSRWSIIAAQLPGRTDNDIKNYWNTKLKKKLMGLLPNSHRKPRPPPPVPLPQPRITTTATIGQHQSLSTYSPSLFKDFYHSYINNYPFPSDNSTLTTTTTTSLVATDNSVLNSRYKPFSIKDSGLLDCGSDPRSGNSNENQQMMMGMMIKNEEEEVVRHDGFDFDQGISQWGETVYNECCFSSEYDLIDDNHNHHGINKLGMAQEKGLYY